VLVRNMGWPDGLELT